MNKIIMQPIAYMTAINGTSSSHTLEIAPIPPKITSPMHKAVIIPAISATSEIPFSSNLMFPAFVGISAKNTSGASSASFMAAPIHLPSAV